MDLSLPLLEEVVETVDHHLSVGLSLLLLEEVPATGAPVAPGDLHLALDLALVLNQDQGLGQDLRLDLDLDLEM